MSEGNPNKFFKRLFGGALGAAALGGAAASEIGEAVGKEMKEMITGRELFADAPPAEPRVEVKLDPIKDLSGNGEGGK